ncbi:hypothetical protein EDC04DRAFT_2199290 [Pisolithus marmoratus]|nr:hypothetical protein EDC04DRAFT_2199290 [Pisolithus marmoratus]
MTTVPSAQCPLSELLPYRRKNLPNSNVPKRDCGSAFHKESRRKEKLRKMFLPSSSLSSSNGSQSPASVHSEYSSDVEYPSPTSSVAADETYPGTSLVFTGQNGHLGLHRRHASSDSIATKYHVLPIRDPGHRRSRSEPSIQRMLDLDANKRYGTGKKPQFKCEDCHQTFTAQFSLKRHQMSHTGERRFACSFPGCNQRFFNNSDCECHEKNKQRHLHLHQS